MNNFADYNQKRNKMQTPERKQKVFNLMTALENYNLYALEYLEIFQQIKNSI